MTMPYAQQDPMIDWADRTYTLRDVNGDKIGDLIEVNPDYVIAESDGGFLGLGEHRRYYVPRQAVREMEDTDWYLSVTKDDVEAQGWDAPPTQSQFASTDWRTRAGIDDTVTPAARATDAEAGTYADTGTSADAGTDTGTGAGRTRLVRYEEQLQAQPVQREAGEVVVRKDVVEEQQTIQVPVRREEVHVERRPVTDAAAASDATAFTETGETIRVAVMEEQVQVTKVARPVEEVVVSKTASEQTQQVSDTVHKERFAIEGDQGRLTDEGTTTTR